ILAKAEGNPFFLEELTRKVAEEGPDPAAIPNTVQGVIMARLDRLPEGAKRLLQTASVLGREVPLGLMRRVWKREVDFTADLDELAATLAYHYARTDLVDEAVAWLTRAADNAARVYANAEAILHLDLARRRLERLPEGLARDRLTIDVALRHAHSLYFLGRFK